MEKSKKFLSALTFAIAEISAVAFIYQIGNNGLGSLNPERIV